MPDPQPPLDDHDFDAVHAPGEGVRARSQAGDAVGGLQVAGGRLVPHPGTGGGELVGASVEDEGLGAHHPGRRIQVVPVALDLDPAGRHRARRRVEPPPVPTAHPPGAHRPRGVHAVPGPAHLQVPHRHDPGRRIQVVPVARDLDPAGRHRARGGQEVPGAVLAVPAGAHVAGCVEGVDRALDARPLRGGIAPIGVAPPPARPLAHPRPTAGEVGCRRRAARGGRIRGGGAGLPAALLCPGGGPGRLGGRRLGAGVIRAGRRDGQDADGEDEAEGGQEALWAHGSHWSSPLWGAVRRTLRPRPPARTPLAG